MLFVNKAQGRTRRGTPQMNDSCWNKARYCQDDALIRNKKLQTIMLGNWNKTIINSFLEMGKSCSNVPNVFKGSSLTGHSNHGC